MKNFIAQTTGSRFHGCPIFGTQNGIVETDGVASQKIYFEGNSQKSSVFQVLGSEEPPTGDSFCTQFFSMALQTLSAVAMGAIASRHGSSNVSDDRIAQGQAASVVDLVAFASFRVWAHAIRIWTVYQCTMFQKIEVFSPYLLVEREKIGHGCGIKLIAIGERTVRLGAVR